MISLAILSNMLFINNTASSEDDTITITSVSGRFARIQAEISNTGETDISNVQWHIAVSGGFLGKMNKTQTGIISNLESQSNEYITCAPIFGLGRFTVTITLNTVEKTFNGFAFLFFIKVFPELIVDFETVASGLTSPVGMVNAGDGSNRLFIIDQTGVINIVENDVLISQPFLNISDKIVSLDQTYDERGLLGLVFHPNYQENGRFFVYYSAPKTGDGINHESILAQYQVSDNANVANPDSELIIFRVDQPQANHNGGQLAFGPDSFLYVGLGDGGGAGDDHGMIGNGQDINTSLGSILRIDVDNDFPYSIPSDNPFVGRDGLDEIYAWGFRNPWKFSFDSQTKDLWVADVGQDEWEEINIVQKGENYGWRIFEGTHPYDLDLADILGIDIETLAYPVHEYSHAVGKSITGGYVYRGEISKELKGKYVFGDWSSSFFIPQGTLFYLEETQPGIFNRFELKPRQPFNRFITSFGEDEQQELYICTKTTLGPSGNSGDVRRLIVQ